MKKIGLGWVFVFLFKNESRFINNNNSTLYRMPRNMTGGSGHRAQRNSETSKQRNNREFVDALLDDYLNGDTTTGVFVGRVMKRMGSGRMEIFYIDDSSEPHVTVQKIMPLRGGLCGKGKKSVWVDVDSIVMVAETGLAGMTHEIVAVFTEVHVARLRRVKPNTDPRIFIKGDTQTDDDKDIFESVEEKKDEEIDIDTI